MFIRNLSTKKFFTHKFFTHKLFSNSSRTQLINWGRGFLAQVVANGAALSVAFSTDRPIPFHSEDVLRNLTDHRPILLDPQHHRLLTGKQRSIHLAYELEHTLFLLLGGFAGAVPLFFLMDILFALAAEHWSQPFVLRKLPLLVLWGSLLLAALSFVGWTLAKEGRRTLQIRQRGRLLPAHITGFGERSNDGVSYTVFHYSLQTPDGRLLSLQHHDQWNFTYLQLQTPDGQQWAGVMDGRSQSAYPSLLTVGTPIAVFYVSDEELYVL